MQDNSGADERPLVKNRPMDIFVALLLLAGSAIVIYDARRMGYGWVEGEGPAAGYFPFYIALALGFASLVTLVKALIGRTADGDEVFVSVPAALRVLTVLLPSIAFVAMIQFLGIYVASTIFIAGFMVVIGGNSILKSVLVGLCVPAVLFLMFEKWFLVPLPKGPLEAMLGL
ncbi:MAG: tripartite tricarboxylate transporter TctB family protein [Hyphomicrobiaceae bacterium]